MAIYQLKRNSLADQIVNEDKLANGSVLAQHIDASVDTDVITEGSNLYFTNTRAISALTPGINMIIDANGLITANVSGGSASVTVANTVPESATEGDLYWDEDFGKLFVYYDDGDTQQWVEASPAPDISNAQIVSALTAGFNMVIDANGLITANVESGGASVTVANTAPAGASEGDLYFDEDLGKLFVYFNDGDTDQWVEAAPIPDVSISNSTIVGALTAGTNMIIDANGLITANVESGGASVSVANAAPEGATEGDLYWDEELGRLFVYYTDSDGSQWIEASPSPGISNTQIISAFTAGTNMIIDSNGLITANVSGGGASVTIANAAPEGATEGDLYWDEDLGKLFIYYVDEDSSQWVDATTKIANVDLTTTEIAEGDNLYFTNARAVGALTAGDQIIIDANGLVTANVSEINLTSVSQNIIPSVTETYSLGSVDYKWKDLYLSGNTLVLGSIALKDSNGTFTTATVESNGYIIPSETQVGAGGGASRSAAFTMSVLFGG